MNFTEINIQGAYLIEPRKIEDERGFFTRTFCMKEMADKGFDLPMVKTNASYSKTKGTLRGLHMQRNPYSEAKLVRCTKGAIFDVFVDLREHSATFLQWFGTELSAERYNMLFIPPGCAHGYLTLEDHTEINYQVSQYYTPEAEVGFCWNDAAFGIQWPFKPVVISAKDQVHPAFNLQSPVVETTHPS